MLVETQRWCRPMVPQFGYHHMPGTTGKTVINWALRCSMGWHVIMPLWQFSDLGTINILNWKMRVPNGVQVYSPNGTYKLLLRVLLTTLRFDIELVVQSSLKVPDPDMRNDGCPSGRNECHHCRPFCVVQTVNLRFRVGKDVPVRRDPRAAYATSIELLERTDKDKNTVKRMYTIK